MMISVLAVLYFLLVTALTASLLADYVLSLVGRTALPFLGYREVFGSLLVVLNCSVLWLPVGRWYANRKKGIEAGIVTAWVAHVLVALLYWLRGALSGARVVHTSYPFFLGGVGIMLVWWLLRKYYWLGKTPERGE